MYVFRSDHGRSNAILRFQTSMCSKKFLLQVEWENLSLATMTTNSIKLTCRYATYQCSSSRSHDPRQAMNQMQERQDGNIFACAYRISALSHTACGRRPPQGVAFDMRGRHERRHGCAEAGIAQ